MLMMMVDESIMMATIANILAMNEENTKPKSSNKKNEKVEKDN